MNSKEEAAFYRFAKEKGFTQDDADRFDEQWESVCRIVLGLKKYRETRGFIYAGRDD